MESIGFRHLTDSRTASSVVFFLPFISSNHQLFPVLHSDVSFPPLSRFYMFIKMFFWQFPVNHSYAFLPLPRLSQLHLLEAPDLVYKRLSFSLVCLQSDPIGPELSAVLFILFAFWGIFLVNFASTLIHRGEVAVYVRITFIQSGLSVSDGEYISWCLEEKKPQEK